MDSRDQALHAFREARSKVPVCVRNHHEVPTAPINESGPTTALDLSVPVRVPILGFDASEVGVRQM